MFHVKHFINRESFVRGIVLSSGFNIVSKVLLFVTSLMFAKFFGAQIKTDFFLFLYNTLWLLITIFSGLHVAVIIPEAMRRREQEGEQQAMHFFTFFLYIFSAISLVLMTLLFLDPVWLISAISKYETAVLEDFRGMIFGIAPLFPLILITQYLVDLLNAYRYFTLPVLTGLFNSLLTLILIWAFHGVLDIFSMILAIYLGYGMNLLHLIYLLRRDFYWDFTPKMVNLKRHFKSDFSVALFGNIWGFLGKFASNFFMTGAGEGLLTAFNYGKKITDVPTEAVSNQFSSVAAIRLNELVAQKNMEKLRLLFSQLCNMMIFLLVPVAALFFFYADDIVSFLYQRGAFGSEAVKYTAFFMRYLGFLVPLMGVNTMVTRLYNARQIVRFSTIYSVISNSLLVGFIWMAYAHYGIWGIPFAMLAQNVLNVVAAQFFMNRFFKGIRYGRILLNLLLFIVGCMALAAGAHRLFVNLMWPGIVKTCAGCAVFAICYVGINETCKINRVASNYIHKWLHLMP